MKPLRKRLAWLGATALVLVSTALYPRIFGKKKLRFTYLTGPLPTNYRALAAQDGWRSASLSVAPSVQLMGLVRPPSAPNAPWVLYYPGNDATQLERGQSFLSRLKQGHDWGLAVFAYRGYDGSSGVPIIGDLATDAHEILRLLCETEKVAAQRVHVVGFSIGGYLAVRAVVAATASNQPPASLSLLASVNDIVMERRSFWSKLDPGDELQTSPFLGDVRAPVLVVQGGADETLGGPIQGQTIAQELGARARYVELPGVGHNVLIETDAALSEVRAFIAAREK